MKMMGCKKQSDSLYCPECNKSGDPGTCLNFRIKGKRQELIQQPNGEVVAF